MSDPNRTTNQPAAVIYSIVTKNAPGMEIDLRATIAVEAAEHIEKVFQVNLKEDKHDDVHRL